MTPKTVYHAIFKNTKVNKILLSIFELFFKEMSTQEEALAAGIRFRRMMDAVAYIPLSSRREVVHVFVGGYGCEQDIPFRAALGIVGGQFDRFKYDFDFLHIKDVREKKWEANDLVNWLLSSHFHFVICHPHQGLEDRKWYMNDLYSQLERLYYHPGFPHGEQLFCPIFTQNKIQYIRAMEPAGLCIPTFECNLTMLPHDQTLVAIYSDDALQQLDMWVKFLVEILSLFLNLLACLRLFVYNRFLEQYKEYNDNRFVVKAPYTTNKSCRWFCTGRSDVLKKLEKFRRDFEGRIPYVMVQPCLKTTKEWKVVVQNEQPKYVGSVGGSSNASNVEIRKELQTFAKGAVHLLRENCPGTIVDGTIRVDIMLYQGRKVVNEFESLEAGIFSKFMNLQLEAKDTQRLYWANVLRKLFLPS